MSKRTNDNQGSTLDSQEVTNVKLKEMQDKLAALAKTNQRKDEELLNTQRSLRDKNVSFLIDDHSLAYERSTTIDGRKYTNTTQVLKDQGRDLMAIIRPILLATNGMINNIHFNDPIRVIGKDNKPLKDENGKDMYKRSRAQDFVLLMQALYQIPETKEAISTLGRWIPLITEGINTSTIKVTLDDLVANITRLNEQLVVNEKARADLASLKEAEKSEKAIKTKVSGPGDGR